MKKQPLMPKATALWLIENTCLTFDQIADFCGLHLLEIQGIADGEIASHIKPIDPTTHGQLVKDEISRCEHDKNATLNFSPLAMQMMNEQKKKMKSFRYTPKARREDKPNAIAWFLKNCPDIPTSKICKLIGTTKNTIDLIKNKEHWNSSNIVPKDPVLLGLCTQQDLDFEHERAKITSAKKAAIS